MVAILATSVSADENHQRQGQGQPVAAVSKPAGQPGDAGPPASAAPRTGGEPPGSGTGKPQDHHPADNDGHPSDQPALRSRTGNGGADHPSADKPAPIDTRITVMGRPSDKGPKGVGVAVRLLAHHLFHKPRAAIASGGPAHHHDPRYHDPHHYDHDRQHALVPRADGAPPRNAIASPVTADHGPASPSGTAGSQSPVIPSPGLGTFARCEGAGARDRARSRSKSKPAAAARHAP
jgi:hypothetical protein